MTDFMPNELVISAVVLAEELSFSAAALRLDTTPTALHAQIGELVARLECQMFQEEDDRVEVTKDGQVLIDGFRLFLARNEKLPE
jgi:DNA-binding transcriptional LysR family regulator